MHTAIESAEVQAKNLTTLQGVQQEIDEHITAPQIVGKLRNLIQQSRFPWYTSPTMTEKELSRSVHKLLWFLKAGYKLGREISDPYAPHIHLSAIAFMSTVTPNEMTMTDAQYAAAAWTDKGAVAHLKTRVKDGLDLVKGKPKERAKAKEKKAICQKCDEVFKTLRTGTKYCPTCTGRIDPAKRYCALGKQCMRAKGKVPALAAPGKQYCSDACLGRAEIYRKQAQKAVDALVNV